MHVTRLRIYPVKSMAGNDLDSAEVQPWGLKGDRRWALVDDSGSKVTAREANAMLGLHAALDGGSALRVVDKGGDSITVEMPRGGATVPVKFTKLDRATPVSPNIDEWLSRRLDRSVRLVWQEDPTKRSILESRGGLVGESVSLADAAPLLLVTESSLRQLNDWIAAEIPADDAVEPLDVVRFRPNVIVDGEIPFAEDHWARIWIGGVEFRRTMICDRCVMPTIDPTTLEGGKEPIRTLAAHRRWDGATWFGIRLVPVGITEHSGLTINVGDSVEVELD